MIEKVLLYSGGMDSYIAWKYLGEPQTLYCNIGHRYSRFEMNVIARTVPWTIVESSVGLGRWEESNANIPMRNAFLCMLGAYYANEVVLVCQKEEMDMPDRSPYFFTAMSDWLSFLNGRDIQVTNPFPDMTKTQMVEWYVRSGFPIDTLLSTRSCYSLEEKACGNCGACFRRWVALINNNLREEYVTPVEKSNVLQDYLKRLEEGKYGELRREETYRALRTAGVL